MKVSELIRELQQLQETCGDLPVIFYDEKKYRELPVLHVGLTMTQSYKRIDDSVIPLNKIEPHIVISDELV